jgi:hypothetical protein
MILSLGPVRPKEQQGLDLHFKVVFAIPSAGGCQWLTSIASNF